MLSFIEGANNAARDVAEGSLSQANVLDLAAQKMAALNNRFEEEEEEESAQNSEECRRFLYLL